METTIIFDELRKEIKSNRRKKDAVRFLLIAYTVTLGYMLPLVLGPTTGSLLIPIIITMAVCTLINEIVLWYCFKGA